MSACGKSYSSTFHVLSYVTKEPTINLNKSILFYSERVSHPDPQLGGCLPLPLHFHQHQLHRQERGRGRVGGDDVLPLLDDIRARQLRLPDVHRQLLHRHFLRPTGMGGYSLTIGLMSVLV